MRILFADDHNLVRQTIILHLKKLNAGNVRIDEADSLPALLKYAGSKPPADLILMDLSMPGMSGVADIKAVQSSFLNVAIVVLSGYSDHETITNCLKSGAQGFIPKDASREEFLDAINIVLKGRKFIPAKILVEPDAPMAHSAFGTKVAFQADLGPIKTLTDREKEILKLLVNGKMNKEIGHDLGIEEITVKLALRRIYKKIGATNRATAARIAALSGL